jgi:hypothetical protein
VHIVPFLFVLSVPKTKLSVPVDSSASHQSLGHIHHVLVSHVRASQIRYVMCSVVATYSLVHTSGGADGVVNRQECCVFLHTPSRSVSVLRCALAPACTHHL